MAAESIKVSNLSRAAEEQHVREFFAFSGEVAEVRFLDGEGGASGKTRSAIITFTEPSAVETAVVLSGAVIVDEAVLIEALDPGSAAAAGIGGASRESAAAVVSSLMAKGYVLAEDAYDRAVRYDQERKLSEMARLRMREMDETLGIQESYQLLKQKTRAGAAKLDDEYHLSERYQQMKQQTRETARELDASYRLSERWQRMTSSVKSSYARAMEGENAQRFAGWVRQGYGSLKESASSLRDATRTQIELERQRKATTPLAEPQPSWNSASAAAAASEALASASGPAPAKAAPDPTTSTESELVVTTASPAPVAEEARPETAEGLPNSQAAALRSDVPAPESPVPPSTGPAEDSEELSAVCSHQG